MLIRDSIGQMQDDWCCRNDSRWISATRLVGLSSPPHSWSDLLSVDSPKLHERREKVATPASVDNDFVVRPGLRRFSDRHDVATFSVRELSPKESVNGVEDCVLKPFGDATVQVRRSRDDDDRR